MKILHGVFTADFGGSENYCAQLARMQAAAGHEVRVMLKGKNPEQVRRFKDILGRDTVVVLPGWLPVVLAKPLMRAVLRGFEPDVVHTHLGRAAVRLGKVAQRMGIPLVASLHLTYSPKYYAHCDGLICVAGWQEPTLDGYAGPYAVIRNWVPEQPTVDSARVQEIRQRVTGGNREALVIGSVGRLDGQKAFDVLIQAFKAAFPLVDSDSADGKGQDVRLVIAGEGIDRAKLEELVGGDSRIHLVGYQRDVANWMAAYDAFVSSSKMEGLALVLLEAVAEGLPLLLTEVPGNLEMADAQGGQTWPGAAPEGAEPLVLTVPPQNVEQLAQGLQRLADRLRGSRAAGLPPRVAYDTSAFDVNTVVTRVDEFYTRANVRPKAKVTGAGVSMVKGR